MVAQWLWTLTRSPVVCYGELANWSALGAQKMGQNNTNRGNVNKKHRELIKQRVSTEVLQGLERLHQIFLTAGDTNMHS